MKVGVISNNDLCLPLLFYFLNNKIETSLYLGASAAVDPRREEVYRFCNNYSVSCVVDNGNQESIYEWMDSIDADFLFVLGHLYKIDNQKSKAKSGMYNIHFGKVPENRGPSPLFWQIKMREPMLSLSIHGLTNKIDAGPVYWSKEIRNEEHFSHNYVQYLFSNLLVEGVNDILMRTQNSSLEPKEQEETKARWFPRPTLKDVMVRWDEMSAEEICSLVSACTNWNAGAITLYQGMEMKIIDASSHHPDETSQKPAGTITGISDAIKVSCIGGRELKIHYLSLNSIPFPARQAKQYGIMIGERLSYLTD